MAQLNGMFDATQIEPNTNDILPAGMYQAIIANSEVVPNKSGSGHATRSKIRGLL